MDTRLQLITFLIFLATTLGDISHLFLPEFGFFQPPQQQPHLPFLYAPPQSPPQSPLQPLPPVSATTEFFLPEIIINRQAKDPQHGNFIPLNQYLPPPADEGSRPIYEDHPRPPSSVYLPPKREEPPNPIVVLDEPAQHGYDYQKPPSSTPRPLVEEHPQQIPPALLPPVADALFEDRPPPPPPQVNPEEPSNGYHYHPPGPTYLPPPEPRGSADAGNVQVRLHVKEMRCLDHQGGFFRSVFKIESFLGAVPTVDNDSKDPKCELKLSRSYLVVNIAAEDFQKCGVQRCGQDLCLRLRFPSIRGMRTGVDSILSLHCKTQNRVAVKTHALKMGVSNDLQARSAGVYAHGGSQNEFRTHIELLRKSSNGYTKHLEPNGLVQLGEDLLLRAHVIAGDGWNYTKLTDVSLQRISPSGDLISSANLITSRGCVNPSMRSVCSQAPVFEPPLGHRLPFKAVMFQGMQSGGEMVLSMRITGCLEHHDCHVSAQECSEGYSGRHRRELKDNSTEFSEISKISFRVRMPQEENGIGEEDINGQSLNYLDPKFKNQVEGWIIGGVSGFICILGLLGSFVYCKVKKDF